MARDRIILSPRHGVNPSLSLCFYCGREKNELVLPGRLPGDAEAPRRAVWNMEPCAECAEHMGRGVIMIQVQDGEEGKENPVRLGGYAVVLDEALRRFIEPPALLDQILRARFVMVPDAVWKAIGMEELALRG